MALVRKARRVANSRGAAPVNSCAACCIKLGASASIRISEGSSAHFWLVDGERKCNGSIWAIISASLALPAWPYSIPYADSLPTPATGSDRYNRLSLASYSNSSA